MTKSPQIFLGHIIESIELIEEYIAKMTEAEFLKNLPIQDAVVRRFEIIGEATKHLPDSLRKEYPTVRWHAVMSMRDRLIHEYFNVMTEVVWDTAKKGLPTFKKQILKMIK